MVSIGQDDEHNQKPSLVSVTPFLYLQDDSRP